MTRRCWISIVVLCIFLGSIATEGMAAVEREKLLTDPGVYATFAIFKMEEDWWKLDKAVRASTSESVKAVFAKHSDRVITDTYLVRGISEKADFMVRLHATDLIHNQNFLLDLMSSPLGKYLRNLQTYKGITKKPTYAALFPEDLKAALKAPAEPGSKPYAIVIPVRKDAAWWNTEVEGRIQMLREHAEASVPYLRTVKRKLYHTTGLDNLDFITYFETAHLEDFNNLVLALQRVKEYRYTVHTGNPILVGTIRPLEDILEVLAR